MLLSWDRNQFQAYLSLISLCIDLQLQNSTERKLPKQMKQKFNILHAALARYKDPIAVTTI